jgi:hypothetical protein
MSMLLPSAPFRLPAAAAQQAMQLVAQDTADLFAARAAQDLEELGLEVVVEPAVDHGVDARGAQHEHVADGVGQVDVHALAATASPAACHHHRAYNTKSV